MNIRIKIKAWLNQHPKMRQWLWFVALWFAGLSTVVILSYPIKLLFSLV